MLSSIKQGNDQMMTVRFDFPTGKTLENVYKVEFVFSQTNPGSPLRTCVWGHDETGDVFGLIHPLTPGWTPPPSWYTDLSIRWSDAQTRLFKRKAGFYMDTRITYKTDGGNAAPYSNPKTNIVKLMMDETLFAPPGD